MRQFTTILLVFIPFFAINAASPYITKVWEYRPAPGQFVNIMPKYEDGDDADDMRLKAEEAIADNNQVMVCLGSWGGYIIFSFDHPVVNDKGNYDLLILGNAFEGSSEPGVVCVSYDDNNNGKPDDLWYELAGSEYGSKSSFLDYQVTYKRPAPDHVATPDNDNKYLIDTTHVEWYDNKGNKGHIMKMNFHNQSHYPLWLDDEQLVFTGTRLPDNGYCNTETNRFVRNAFEFGYADNKPNIEDAAKLKIDWAVKTDGTPANLRAIHFVKVYTGTNQYDYYFGKTGETSTEIIGAEDLHPDMVTALPDYQYEAKPAAKIMNNGQIIIIRHNETYNIYGTKIQ